MDTESNADRTGPTTDALTEDPVPTGCAAPSLVLVNTGNGKGKSSSAFGMMLRALAVDWNVAVCQFIKSSDWKVGEEKMGRQLGVDWHAFGDGFTWDSDDLEQDKAHAREGWATASELIERRRAPARHPRRAHLPVQLGLARHRRGRRDDRNRPEHVNVVITGRDAPPAIVELADTVTEMTEVKHAYQQGIRAKRGIDY
jgi:cob(I)alamin adenosyltransferase